MAAEFHVTAALASGSCREVGGLRPETTLAALYGRVAEAFDVPLLDLAICLGTRCFGARELRESLGELGISAGAELTAVRRASAGEPAEYRVMQGVLFKKPGEDPASQRVVRVHRPVGSAVRATGRAWEGRFGNEWVELDPFAEKPGWLLLEGSGFGHPGPLLRRVAPGEGEPVVLRVNSPLPEYDHLFDMCLLPCQTVLDAKQWLALRCPGLRVRSLEVARMRPRRSVRNFPSDGILADEVLIRDTPFKDGDELLYFYMGDAEEDMGLLGGAGQAGDGRGTEHGGGD